MDRDRLRTLLLAAQGEAVPIFLSLIEDPRASIHPDSEQRSNATDNILAIYRRRAEHVRNIGLSTLGFDETVEKLEATAHERLTLALASAEVGYPSCVAFMTQDLSEVVAALAVLGPPSSE